MTKVTRQDLNEKYNVTSDWLKDFSKDLFKNAENLDYLKDYLNKNKKYSSIEEKLDDIKQRIGFDLSSRVLNELNKTSTIEKSSSCHCDDKCGCKVSEAEDKEPVKKKFTEDEIKKMSNVLTYIKDMIKNEPDVDISTVIAKCREEDGLDFSKIRLDMGKLHKFIEGELEKNNRVSGSKSISYVPINPSDLNTMEEDKADYFKHSEPNKY